jgi:hypothetical protein
LWFRVTWDKWIGEYSWGFFALLGRLRSEYFQLYTAFSFLGVQLFRVRGFHGFWRRFEPIFAVCRVFLLSHLCFLLCVIVVLLFPLEMALSCSSHCLRKSFRSFLGASFAHGGSLGFPLSPSSARVTERSPRSSSRSFHRTYYYASANSCATLYSRCGGSICMMNPRWKQARTLPLCSRVQNSRAFSIGSSESIEVPMVVETDEMTHTESQHYQTLRDELEAKKRELEAKIIENALLRDALRDAESRSHVTEKSPVPVELLLGDKDFEVDNSSQEELLGYVEIVETGALSGGETLEGTHEAQEGMELVNADSVVEGLEATKKSLDGKDRTIPVVAQVAALEHPWPEWRSFLEQLEADKYFDFEADENKGAEDVELGQDAGRIKRAAMAFARQRDDILRALSRKTLQTLAQFGCPSIDRKAVNAGKRLRAFLQIEEVHVSNLPFLFF